MKRSRGALAGPLAGLVVLAGCSSSGSVLNRPVTRPAGIAQSVTNESATQGDHAQPGDVVLTSADNGRAVTITIGETVAAVIPHAIRVFVADSAPEVAGPVPGGTTAVLNPLGDFRFRAVGAGQVGLAAEYNCGRGASCALHWIMTVNVHTG